MTNVWHNGIGGTLGDSLATCEPLLTRHDIWYVHASTGTDAATPAGKNREEPLATLQQAVTNAAASDIIVCLDGHTETIAANVNVNKKLVIIGEGLSGGIPTVVLTPNLTGAAMLSLAAQGCQLRGIKIAANAQSSATAKVLVSAANVTVRGCYFQCGANDAAGNLELAAGSSSARLRSTTFISTGTSRAAQPVSAITLTAAISDAALEDVVVSAGAYGFTGMFAVDLSNFQVTRICIENMSLLLGADMSINGSTDGYVHVGTCTGGSRVSW